jgi:hypothetical protein
MSIQSNHYPETLEAPENTTDQGQYEASAILGLTAAVNDLTDLGWCFSDLSQLVAKVYAHRVANGPDDDQPASNQPVPF